MTATQNTPVRDTRGPVDTLGRGNCKIMPLGIGKLPTE